MTVEALASVDDLADRLPDGIADAQVELASALLVDASAKVRAEARREWDTTDVPPIAVTITLAAAKRAWLNLDEVTSMTVGAYSERRDGQTGIYLTESEVASLRQLRPDSDLWVQRVGRSRSSEVHDMSRITLGGDRIPWYEST